MTKLTDADCRNAAPSDRPYKLQDAEGMYLLVDTNGSRYWRMNFRFAGKRDTHAIGVYPKVSLKEARIAREAARRLLASGVNPNAARKLAKAAKLLAAKNSFEAVAVEWLAKFGPRLSKKTVDKHAAWLKKDVFPSLGRRPIAEIKPKDVLDVLRPVEARGTLETAHRLRGLCSQIFRYAVCSDLIERDPTADLRGALPPSSQTAKHHASITDPKLIGPLLLALDSYRGRFITRCALKLAPLVFVRPGELRQALWSEINLDEAEWHFKASKTHIEHTVPLSRQAVEILKELQPLTGRGRYVFAGMKDHEKPMSSNTVNKALRTMGYDNKTMTGHGFRAMARTVLDEVLGYRPDWIEAQLAHAVRDANGRAYNRTSHIADRRKMMQAWADYLDTLREVARGGNVVAVDFRAADGKP